MMRHKPTGEHPDPVGDHLAAALGAVTQLNDTMQELHLGMKTRRGARLVGADAHPFSLPSAPFASAAAAGNPGAIIGPSTGALMGFSLRETGASATMVHILDGNDLGGLLLWTGNLPSLASETEWFPGGISYSNGIYIHPFQGAAGGVVEGVLYTAGGKQ